MRAFILLSIALLTAPARAETDSAVGPCGTGKFVESNTTVKAGYFSILAVKGLLCEIGQDGRSIHFAASARQSQASLHVALSEAKQYPGFGTEWTDPMDYFQARGHVCQETHVRKVRWVECRSTGSGSRGWYESFEARDLWRLHNGFMANISYHYPKGNPEFKEPFEQIVNSITLE